MEIAASPLYLHELSSLHDAHLCAWLDLYEAAFPPEERGRVSWIIQTLQAREAGSPTDSRLWALLDRQDHFLGMAQASWNADLRLCYLGYFAILPEMRGQGYGSAFYALLLKELDQADLLVFDVESPDRLDDPALRLTAERRINFYERQGAMLLPRMTLRWGTIRQRIMIHGFTQLDQGEVLCRIRAHVLRFAGELQEDA